METVVALALLLRALHDQARRGSAGAFGPAAPFTWEEYKQGKYAVLDVPFEELKSLSEL